MEKRLLVFGRRRWENGFPTEPEKMTSLPLIYKNAFGGEGYEKNPAGIGFQDGMLPLIEYPETLVASPKETPVPAAFCAMDIMVPQRMQYKGTYDLNYKNDFFPGHPADMDWKLFLLTCRDQWHNDFFKGDESYALHNMHPEMPEIEGKLPGLYARCFVMQQKKEGDTFGEIPLNLDTIWFFPEKCLGLLTFRGVVEVDDDEAESVTHLLGAYEYLSRPPRSLAYYKDALDKRINSDDALLKFLTTSDLIPEDHKCAMELLFVPGDFLGEPQESELVKNVKAKSEAIQTMANQRVEEEIKKAEKQMDAADIPDSEKTKVNGLDIINLMKKTDTPESDPEQEALYQKMEAIFPGITSGDTKKMDMKHFSMEKLQQVSNAAKEFADEKKANALKQLEQKINNARNDLEQRIDDMDTRIGKLKNAIKEGEADVSGQLQMLEDAKKQLEQNFDMMVMPDLDNPPQQPLPRLDSDKIRQQLDIVPAFPPELMEGIQHLQGQKAAGIDDDVTQKLEEQVRAEEQKYNETFTTIKETVETNLITAQKNFQDGYLMGAHYMDDGLSPHKAPLEEVKTRFLDAVHNNEDVSGMDWACLDLSGGNLDGIDLSGAFLEQVNFKGASLKGTNLSKSNLARACLDDADFSQAILEEANIGAVSAVGTNFSGANMKSAKLSKGNFTKAVFTGADLEKIEAQNLILNDADLSSVHISCVYFIDSQISGIICQNADIALSMFIKGDIENADFSGSVFNRCGFIDIHFNSVCFDRADLSNSAFVASAPEKSSMEEMSFKQAKFYQTNLMNMVLKGADFSSSDLEKAFFWNADLTGANLCDTYAKTAQFRKTKLTGAKLDNINLYQGSLAKANLVDASFKGANLCQADLLRSTITNTDFSGSNLDMTIIENWKPK